MQRLSKKVASQALKTVHIDIPASVQVAKQADQLVFTGPLGTNRLGLSQVDTEGSSALRLLPQERQIAVCSISKPFFGTLTSLIRAKVHGVTQGYIEYLRIQGIGYRAALNGQTLTLKLGYSHDIKYTLPESLRAFLPEPTLVGLYGIDKNQITQAAANIRRLRPPDAYKGKGIRYEGEKLKLKPGKRK